MKMATGVEMMIGAVLKLAGITPEQMQAAIKSGLDTKQQLEIKIDDFDKRFVRLERDISRILELLEKSNITLIGE
jgi:hypothetical protein